MLKKALIAARISVTRVALSTSEPNCAVATLEEGQNSGEVLEKLRYGWSGNVPFVRVVGTTIEGVVVDRDLVVSLVTD